MRRNRLRIVEEDDECSGTSIKMREKEEEKETKFEDKNA